MPDRSLADVATLMQSAAVDPAGWEAALNAVNAFAGCNGVVLLSVQGRQKFAPCSTDLAEMIDDYFAGGWYLNDRREACIPLLKARGIVVDHDFQSTAQIEEGDYYHDFLSRHKRKWFAGVGVEIEGDHWCLSLQRSAAADPFGATDLAKLDLVRGLLADAARLSVQIGRAWAGGLQHALSLMAHPAILFGVNGHVLFANAAAEALSDPSISGQRDIRFGCARTTDAFNAMLAKALNPWTSSSRDREQIISSRNGAFACHATSLLNHDRLLANNAAALVVMRPIVPNPADVMKSRFGLTDAETRVSLALADGKSVKDIAAANEVKENTIRSQLKSVYNKTGTHTQSRLVAFVRDLASSRS